MIPSLFKYVSRVRTPKVLLVTGMMLVAGSSAAPPPLNPGEQWEMVLNQRGEWLSGNSMYRLEWDGRANETYFVQFSTTLNGDWIYVPVIEQGMGAYQFDMNSSSSLGFLRIIPETALSATPETDDHDGDGIGSLEEINSSPQTSPVRLDTDGNGIDDGGLTDRDGDGIPTAYELANGLDPLVANSATDLANYLASLAQDQSTNIELHTPTH